MFRLTGPGIPEPLVDDWPSEAFAQRRRDRAAMSAGEPRPVERKHRTTDPETSRQAAVAAAPRAGTCKARLLEAIAAAPNGLTAHAASEASGVTYVTASTRLTELVRDGLLSKTGFTRETANGGEADVLVLAGSALAAAGRSVAV